LKPEQWGSLLVQEKYQEEKACDKRHPYRIIIIIIIVIIIIIIIIMIIIMFINCNWVDTRWQWLFYVYTKYEIGYY
jgi:ABC-type multidrug transport system permease subunit